MLSAMACVTPIARAASGDVSGIDIARAAFAIGIAVALAITTSQRMTGGRDLGLRSPSLQSAPLGTQLRLRATLPDPAR